MVPGPHPGTIYKLQFHAARDELIDLAESMHQSATVIDPLTARQHYSASHRHTRGAHELAADGVRMLACAGETYFEFADLIGRGARLAG